MYGYIDIERYSCLYGLLPPIPRSALFIIRFSEVLDERYHQIYHNHEYSRPYLKIYYVTNCHYITRLLICQFRKQFV